jgi:hypothetical protein
MADLGNRSDGHEETTGLPLRKVVQGDAFAWLAELDTLGAGVCVVTSLPDRSELVGVPGPEPNFAKGVDAGVGDETSSRAHAVGFCGEAVSEPVRQGSSGADKNRGQLMSVEAYGRWLAHTAGLLVGKLEEGCAAVFYQTDTRSADDGYIDKGFYVTQGALAAGGNVLFHKIVLRSPPDCPTSGINPSFSHLLAFGSPKGCHAPPPNGLGARSCPDVCSKGVADWPKGTGPLAASHAIKYLRDGLQCATVLDPFCGTGCVLAVAEFHGCGAVGVELHKGRSRAARRLSAVRSKGGGLELVRPLDVRKDEGPAGEGFKSEA